MRAMARRVTPQFEYKHFSPGWNKNGGNICADVGDVDVDVRCGIAAAMTLSSVKEAQEERSDREREEG